MLETPDACEAVLNAWPVSPKQRRPKQAEGLTYDEAWQVVLAYYVALGWLPKVGVHMLGVPAPKGYYAKDAYTYLPLGFPPERDTNWQPIPFCALISPSFDGYVTGGQRSVTEMLGMMRPDYLASQPSYWSWTHFRSWNTKTRAYQLWLAARAGLGVSI